MPNSAILTVKKLDNIFLFITNHAWQSDHGKKFGRKRIGAEHSIFGQCNEKQGDANDQQWNANR